MKRGISARPQIILGQAVLGSILVLTGLVLGLGLTTIGAHKTGEFSLSKELLTNPNLTLIRIGEFVNTAFGVVWAPVVTLIIAFLTWLKDKVSGYYVLAFTMIGWLPCGLLKYAYQRPRPGLLGLPTFVNEMAADSLPSGHTAFAAALTAAFCLIALRAGRGLVPVLLIGIGITGFSACSAIITGRHFLGDTITSVFLAVGFVLLAASLLPMLDRFWPTKSEATDPARRAA